MKRGRARVMVQRLDVEFQSEGDTVRGWLYTPDEGGRRPTVVLAAGWCYVRELTMPTYAQKVAENGFHALILHYRTLRVSGGDHTTHLDPWTPIRGYQTAHT